MKLSDYLKEQHMSTTRGTDDTYPELFMVWWGELELEDLDKLAEGWLEDKKTALLSDNISSFRGRRIHTENRPMTDLGITWSNIIYLVVAVIAVLIGIHVSR